MFGFDLFSVGTDDTTTVEPGGPGGDGGSSCEVAESVLLDVELGNGVEILNIIGQYGPSNATPLLLTMANYTIDGYAPIFQNGEAKSYLVIISDGKDSCGLDGVFDGG